MVPEDKLELKATIEVESNIELYRIVDFLNKNLKEKNLIFGLSKKDRKMTVSIYET
ncbi:MAG: YpmA family protein [Clostridiaceae bacterium]|nr:YpmA family protein [Clostridiaceae bacterium]